MPGKRGHSKARPDGWLQCDEIALARLFPDAPDWLLARVFGRSPAAIASKANSLKLRKSAAYRAENDTRFKAGNVPPNKGVKRPGFAPGRVAETQFKKGRPASEARNYLPIGSVRIHADGYLERKVTDDPAIYPARRWTAEHRLVWIAAHGPIPEGYIVAFKPGRSTTVAADITLDAVELITRKQLMARNTVHNLPPELVELVQLRGRLNRVINQRSKTE